MKSQDIVLLLKLVSLERRQRVLAGAPSKAELVIPADWRGWQGETGNLLPPELSSDSYTVRGLSETTGISKSEISGAMRRCMDVGLAKPDRKTREPRANTKALYELIAYGIRYVFPAKPGPIVRGIPTAHAAPVLSGKLMSAGEHICVWEDAFGQQQGQSVTPLFKTVPLAVRHDAELYAMLALVDAIRLGQERESALAKGLLEHYLRGSV